MGPARVLRASQDPDDVVLGDHVAAPHPRHPASRASPLHADIVGVGIEEKPTISQCPTTRYITERITPAAPSGGTHPHR